MRYYKNIFSKIKNYFNKNSIKYKELKLLKKELENGFVANSNIYFLFIVLNLYLLLPNTYINKLHKRSDKTLLKEVIGLALFKIGRAHV